MTVANESDGTRERAVEATKSVADTARGEAAGVAEQAKGQARNLVDEARSQASSQARTQQDRVARSLHSVGDELQSMAENSGQSGVVTELARQASGRVHDVAGYFERQDPQGLLEEVRVFARRRPGTFLLGAAIAGVITGRLVRGAAQNQKEQRDRQGLSGDYYRSGGYRQDYEPGYRESVYGSDVAVGSTGTGRYVEEDYVTTRYTPEAGAAGTAAGLGAASGLAGSASTDYPEQTYAVESDETTVVEPVDTPYSEPIDPIDPNNRGGRP
jgi:hypothetical protein